MEYVIGLFFGILGSLVAAELYCWAPHIARKSIERAVLRLPESERDRFREEWLAHLDECPGSLAKLWHSLGCFQGAAAMTAVAPKVALVWSSKTRTVEFIKSMNFLMKAAKGEVEFVFTRMFWRSIGFGVGLGVAATSFVIFWEHWNSP